MKRIKSFVRNAPTYALIVAIRAISYILPAVAWAEIAVRAPTED